MDCVLIVVDEKRTTGSVHTTRRTIDSEDMIAQRARSRAFVKELEPFRR
jgi:hypothetical protein